MKYNTAIFSAALAVLLSSPMFADEPAKTSAAAEADELTKEAQETVKELEASYSEGSEPIAMLKHILKGSRLGPGEGWFGLAVSQTRFGWEHVAKSYDTDGDGKVSASEFTGSKGDFARLDRDGDGSLNETDFDWSEHSLSRSPGQMLFMQADRDGNGKLTSEEFAGLFKSLDRDEHGFVSLDELKDALQPPPAGAQAKRNDLPSRSTLIMGLKRQEIGSLQPGPSLDDDAPDFTLTSLDGNDVTLSEEVGDKPIVLVFGNFTCGPFRSQSGNIEKLYERYQDRAKFFLVYVREAHPSDGWWMTSNQRVGIELPQPRNNNERRDVAAMCQEHLDLKIPFLVDTVDDKVGATYSGMPNRLYVIDRDGKIAFKNGRGPFGFHPRQLEQALVLLLNATAAK
ncbi:MAG: deiodinase family protein [Planctomycetaceae bacterium]